jgi:pyrimidine-nucleoside phosphorylase
VLDGKGPKDVVELTVELGAEMLVLGGVSNSLEGGRQKIREVLSNGKAMEKFAQIIEAQAGNPRVIHDRSLLGKAQTQIPVRATRQGYLKAIDARLIGIASMTLGGGRQQVTDQIDPLVGIETHVRIGDEVREGQTLFVLHANGKGEEDALRLVRESLQIGDEPISAPKLFGPRITKDELHSNN